MATIESSAAKITPPVLEKLILDRYGLNKKQIKTVIRDLIFSRELTYTYEFGCTFLERSLKKPVRISRHVVLIPPDHSYRSKPNDVMVQITPGASFGAGNHPTTRLAIKAIEYVLLGDPAIEKKQEGTVLDIGTGSGILILAAVLGGMEGGLGIDIDACARVEAATNVKNNGLEDKNVTFSKNAIMTLIRRYTRESGVRNLEREISSVCRKLAREVLKETEKIEFKVTEKSVSKFLGPYRFRQEQVEEKDQVGMVIGLAWTQVGGELLFIETLIMPGKGKLTVTGKLGEVMQESAQAALSYVRSRAANLMIDDKFYKKFDIHIHIPEGAIPKDGPSAGISMCTSLVSALTKRAVYRDIAMTGEITLRGRVLPIGGLKEKIIAAHRGGIKKVLIPKENEKDLRDVPNSISKQLEIISVEHMDEVLGYALIQEEGDVLFKKVDIPFEIATENSGESRPMV